MIVVDTNVVAYLVARGQRTDMAEEILRRDSDWAAPSLLRSELCNTLLMLVRRQGMALPSAVEAFHAAEARMDGGIHEPSYPDVLDLAVRSGCTAYDCEFVALARQLGVPLVTSDRQVLQAFPETALSPEAFVGH